MKRNIVIIFLLLSFIRLGAVCDTPSDCLLRTDGISANQDDSLYRQILYNGRIWRNLYIRIEGDPYFLSDKFSPGTIEISNKTFVNIPVRYDIYNDEIHILTDKDMILQLNKEMVNSFTVMTGDVTDKFIKLEKSEKYPVSGYVNLLYSGDLSLVVKYRKEIDLSSSNKVYGTFYQLHRIYVLKDSIMHLVGGRRSLLKLLEDKEREVRNFIKTNKLIIVKKYPENFVPVLEFYDKSQ